MPSYGEQVYPRHKQVKRRVNTRYYQHHDSTMCRQIRSLLYDQGFTIGGARQYLDGHEAHDDSHQAQQIIRQVRMELEEILHILKR